MEFPNGLSTLDPYKERCVFHIPGWYCGDKLEFKRYCEILKHADLGFWYIYIYRERSLCGVDSGDLTHPRFFCTVLGVGLNPTFFCTVLGVGWTEPSFSFDPYNVYVYMYAYNLYMYTYIYIGKRRGIVYCEPRLLPGLLSWVILMTRIWYAHYCLRHWVKSHPDEKVGDRHGKLVTCCSWLWAKG